MNRLKMRESRLTLSFLPAVDLQRVVEESSWRWLRESGLQDAVIFSIQSFHLKWKAFLPPAPQRRPVINNRTTGWHQEYSTRPRLDSHDLNKGIGNWYHTKITQKFREQK